MCRLLYFPPNCKLSQKNLQELLKYLELSNGGHGNGFGAVQTGKQTIIYKGLKVGCDKIAAQMIAYSARGYHCVFHTRLVSCGSKDDNNCHPFLARKTLICHNGHDSTMSTLAHYRDRGECDTRVFAALYKQRGFKWLVDKNYYPASGVWFMVNGRKQMVHIKGGFNDLVYDPDTGIWASEYPMGKLFENSFQVADGLHDLSCNKTFPLARSYGWSVNDRLLECDRAKDTTSNLVTGFGYLGDHSTDPYEINGNGRKIITNTSVELNENQSDEIAKAVAKSRGRANKKSDCSTLIVPQAAKKISFVAHNRKQKANLKKDLNFIHNNKKGGNK